MINVCVLSRDTIFAGMLKNELKAEFHGCAVHLNSMGGQMSEERCVFVLDLDSTDVLPTYGRAVGFSRDETGVSSEKLKRCEIILHRPFPIKALTDEIYRMILKSPPAYDGVSDKTGNEEPAITPAPRLSLEKDGAYLDGVKLRLSANEHAVLRVLYENMSNTVSRDELKGVLSSSEGNMCDAYVCRLRAKLEKNGGERFIFTVRGKGYMLKI